MFFFILVPIKPPSIRQNISNTSSEQSTPGIKTSPQNPIDIQVLREKSKHLDLPLISALCNDRSLLKQTKAFVAPKNLKTTGSVNTTMTTTTEITTTAQSISKPRKTSISHRHPNDKLPPLPVQTAEANNYVMDPTPVNSKHKSFSSQRST